LDITGIYHEKRATIISASIPKYVDGIRGCTTQAFPGATKFEPKIVFISITTPISVKLD
jgi:hypothetical protein